MRRRFFLLAAGVIVLGSCGSATPAGSASSGLAGSITVFAASSLTAAFTKIGRDFEKAYPGTTIHLTFAGSATLSAQIQQGAPGDVFASADQPNMQRLVDARLVQGSPLIFVRNRLQVVVAQGNPKHIHGLAELARSDTVLVVCAPVVPCGRYAEQTLQKAGVAAKPASQEADVNAVVSKVSLGEADAGIVYVTDVKAAGARVQGVDIPDNLNVIAEYPIAVLKDTQNVALAKAFVGYVLEDLPSGPWGGQRTLRQYGFLPP